MKALYSTGIYFANVLIKGVSVFNKKLKLGVIGRSETFSKLKNHISKDDKTLWFHCASLGEYEQGLPVFEELKKKYPDHKIVLSFFSPSGYEIRKNAPIADVVIYIPLDTTPNAKQFLDLVRPDLIVFVKYEIWPNFLHEVKRRQLRAILISATFRASQSFFKPYGGFMKNALFAFEHIFTQDEASKVLLESIDYSNVSISGDTRFDRVSHQLKIDNTLDFINEFKQDQLCIVAGSTWPEGEALFIDFINNANTDTKFIIAPHNIKPQQIQNLEQKLQKKTVLFSKKEQVNIGDAQVFIIDTIGILTKIYSYADIAYIGGALGKTGLHNTLEAAVFGVPIIIGNHYNKFPEANQLQKKGGLFSISNQQEFNSILNTLIEDKSLRLKAGELNLDYISEHRGATSSIIKAL